MTNDEWGMDCKEFFWDDLLEVAAIPNEVITRNRAGLYSPVVDGSQYVIGDSSGIVVLGNIPVMDAGVYIPVTRHSGSVSDIESDSVAGRSHKVTVSVEVDDRGVAVLNPLRDLEYGPYSLYLVFRNGMRAWVFTMRDGYHFTLERSDGKTTAKWALHTIAGVQVEGDGE